MFWNFKFARTAATCFVWSVRRIASIKHCRRNCSSVRKIDRCSWCSGDETFPSWITLCCFHNDNWVYPFHQSIRIRSCGSLCNKSNYECMQIFKLSVRKLRTLVCDINAIKGISENYAEGVCYRFKCQSDCRSLNLVRSRVKDLVYLSNIPFFLRKLFFWNLKIIEAGKIIKLFARNCFSQFPFAKNRAFQVKCYLTRKSALQEIDHVYLITEAECRRYT